jgi:hypothetical protein
MKKAHGETLLNRCLATSCKHNQGQACTLDHIDVDVEGKCKQFSGKVTKLSQLDNWKGALRNKRRGPFTSRD